MREKLFGNIGSTVTYLRCLTRVRHFRGHGVHSPFVYSLVRNVFMPKYFYADDHLLYDSLRSIGISSRAARQIQNLHSYCEYDRFVIYPDELPTAGYGLLTIIPPNIRFDSCGDILENCAHVGSTAVMMVSRNSASKLKLAEEIAGKQECLVIENRRYVIFFNDNSLPPQYFKL